MFVEGPVANAPLPPEALDLRVEDAECACCFTESSGDGLTSCPAGHSFCKTCLNQYAATQLGHRKPVLVCMDTSECSRPFSSSVLKVALESRTFQRYEKMLQNKEIRDANIPGLEECPFCDWACVLESISEKDVHFKCGDVEECGIVSCRQCKKKSHWPEPCERSEENSRLQIEEARTRALVRNCPRCQTGVLILCLLISERKIVDRFHNNQLSSKKMACVLNSFSCC